MIHVKEEKIERVTLTVVELAQLLGVTETSIYKMVREGQVPHFRVRKKYFSIEMQLKTGWLVKNDERVYSSNGRSDY